MANTTVLHHATVLKRKSEETIKKEVALNLLEDLLTLCIRVRSFSFANDKQQAYKIQQSRIRARSLRTTLKQQTHSVPEWNFHLVMQNKQTAIFTATLIKKTLLQFV